MTKFYGTADDKYVGSTCFYVDSNSNIFVDKDCEVLATTEEIVHAFEQDAIVLKNSDGAYAKPVAVSVTSKVATVVAAFDATDGLAEFTNEVSA